MKTVTFLLCMILAATLCPAQDNGQKKETGNGTGKGYSERVDSDKEPGNKPKVIRYFDLPENWDSYKNMEGFSDSNLREVYKEIRSLGLKNKRSIHYILFLSVEEGTARPVHCVLDAHAYDSIGINEINKIRDVLMKTWFSGVDIIEDDGKRISNVQSGLVWWGGTFTARHTGGLAPLQEKQ